MNLPVLFTIAGLGATVAQVILIREIMQLLFGNELSAGLALGSWLFWAGIGALSLGRFLPGNEGESDSDIPEDELASAWRNVPGKKIPLGLYLFVLGLLGFSTLATIFLIRLSRVYLGIPFGEIAGIGLMWLITFVTIAPVAFIGGGLFSLSNRVYSMW